MEHIPARPGTLASRKAVASMVGGLRTRSPPRRTCTLLRRLSTACSQVSHEETAMRFLQQLQTLASSYAKSPTQLLKVALLLATGVAGGLSWQAPTVFWIALGSAVPLVAAHVIVQYFRHRTNDKAIAAAIGKTKRGDPIRIKDGEFCVETGSAALNRDVPYERIKDQDSAGPNKRTDPTRISRLNGS
jgi:hypothetical protein